MQEEIEHKTVNFAISTVKLSARTLLKGAQFFLRQYDKSASQGKQSMKRLIRQNRGVTNLEIEKTGIKDFDRYAKRYHIDYAIQKDLSCTPPRFLIFFKAQDTLPSRAHGRSALSVSRHWVLGTVRKKSRRCWLVGQSIIPIRNSHQRNRHFSCWWTFKRNLPRARAVDTSVGRRSIT